MKNINIDNLPDSREILNKGFEQYDDYRAKNLKNLSTAKQARTKQLDREHARLLRKYGENHSLTVRTRAKIELNRLQQVELKKEIVRAETPEPTAGENKWTVYGYVLAADGKPASGVPVFLFDEKRQKIEAAEFVKTSADGYFILETEKIKSLPATVYAGASPREINRQALKPQAGKTEYVEIFLLGREPPPGGTPTVNPPPPPKGWTVAGKIRGTKGEGLAGLTVKVYDKDVFDDDFLGETQTDERGFYSVTFPKEKFSDFMEEYPEVYLVIENAAGDRIYDGRSRTNYGAGYIELLDVELKNLRAE